MFLLIRLTIFGLIAFALFSAGNLFVTKFASSEEATLYEKEAADLAAQAAKNAKAYEGLARLLNQARPDINQLQGNLPESLQAQIPDSDHPAFAGGEPPRLMVFLSLSMPDQSLRNWMAQTEAAGGYAVIRGFYGGKMSTTLQRVNEIKESTNGLEGGVGIDPTAFKRLNIIASPTVVVLAEPLLPCKTEGCLSDPTPDADRIAGNTSLNHALSRLAREGDVAPDVSRKYLSRLIENGRGR